MTSVRQQNRRGQKAAPRNRTFSSPRAGSKPATHAEWLTGRSLSMAAAAVAVVVVAGALFAVLRPKGDDDGPRTGGPSPIAKLDTADVHSLLIDPANPDRVLFGSHAGIMESRDGGFSW